MRVLWCTHSSAGLMAENGGYNGCGWIYSLLEEFRKVEDVQIGVAFFHKTKETPIKRDRFTLFPIERGKVSLVGKLRTYFKDYSAWEEEDQKHLNCLKSIIEDFKPDIIHVWGTETEMGIISKYTNVPVIIHLQGILNPYNNALFPPGVSRLKYILKDGFSPASILKNVNTINYWNYKSQREIQVFKSCKNYFGRTHWDKAISKLYSPKRSYFLCNELLRPEFSDSSWAMPKGNIRILSTISSPLYKGADVVLKTANLLKKHGDFDFEWGLIGITDIKFQESLTGIKAKEVNVICLGVKTASEVKELELNSHLYFHSSYIDNSPNSVCEAQLLGLPIVSINVGGVASLIEHDKTGLLVPANEPHIAAAKIIELLHDIEKISKMSESGRKVASLRHNPQEIINNITEIYHKLL